MSISSPNPFLPDVFAMSGLLMQLVMVHTDWQLRCLPRVTVSVWSIWYSLTWPRQWGTMCTVVFEYALIWGYPQLGAHIVAMLSRVLWALHRCFLRLHFLVMALTYTLNFGASRNHCIAQAHTEHSRESNSKLHTCKIDDKPWH